MRKTPLAQIPHAQITACLPQRDHRGLVCCGDNAHVDGVSSMSSNMTAYVENRYPSPLARAECSPFGSRHFSVHAVYAAYAPKIADFADGMKKNLASSPFESILCSGIPQQRAAKCAKQFSLSPFCPQQPSQGVWKTKICNALSSVLALAVSLVKSSPMANVLPEPLSAPQAVHCSTTCNFAAERPAHRTPISHHQRFPRASVREPFSIGAPPIAAHPVAWARPMSRARL